MKAAVVVEDGRLELQDIAVPQPGPYGCLVKIDACVACTGTDLNIISGQFPWREELPVVLGHESTGVIVEAGEKVRNFRILKLKVGVPGDLESVAAVREVWPHAIRVDANIGWKPKEAIERIRELAKYDIEFVEQPIPPGNNRALKRVQQAVSLPIITDESSVVPEDVLPLAGCVAGINIKLMKCGGITRALQMIHTARSLGMKIMLGCMLETSIAITAAAHLTPLVAYADLDGNYLIADDPFEGVKVVRGKLTLSDEPGLGVRPRS